jgi:hypothetical protein
LPNEKAKTTQPKMSKPKKAPVKRGSKTARKEKSSAASGSSVPWTFPKHTLEDAIRVAKAIEDKNAGNPMPAASVAIAVG